MSLELGPILRALRHAKGAASLLVLEVALGLVVAVYAYTLGEWTLGEDPRVTGIDEEDVALVRVLDASPPSDVAAAEARVRAEREQLRGALGVRAVAAVRNDPIVPSLPDVVEVRDAAPRAFAWRVEADEAIADALGVAIAQGRALTRADAEAGASDEIPVLLSEAIAAKLFPGRSAIGAHVRVRVMARDAVVVGVVRSYAVLAGLERRSLVYVPARPALVAETRYVVRSAPEAREAIASRLAAALGGSSAAQLVSVEPLRPQNPEKVNGRSAKGMARAIALVAFCIVCFGALATSSFLVAERHAQIAIRRALGARKVDIVRYFLVENALLTSLGLALGAALSFGLDALVHRLVPHALIGLEAAWVAVGASLFLVASLGAALVPAMRAASIRPAAAAARAVRR